MSLSKIFLAATTDTVYLRKRGTIKTFKTDIGKVTV